MKFWLYALQNFMKAKHSHPAKFVKSFSMLGISQASAFLAASKGLGLMVIQHFEPVAGLGTRCGAACQEVVQSGINISLYTSSSTFAFMSALCSDGHRRALARIGFLL